LGPIRSVTFAPCGIGAVKDQLSRTLELSWKTRLPVPLVWHYADGTTKPTVHQVDASQEPMPHITLEVPDAAQSCTTDQTPVHIVYVRPDVVGAERRLAESGMALLGRAALLTTYFRSTGGLYVEIGHSGFELAELLP
jgi:hypothetical protein